MTVQSMPLKEILNLQSCDFMGTVGHNLGRVDFLAYRPNFYTGLRQKMTTTHSCAIPVCVIDGWLYNGHHRVAIAVDIGLNEIPVTDTPSESNGPVNSETFDYKLV